MELAIVRFCNQLARGSIVDGICLVLCEIAVMIALFAAFAALAVWRDRPRGWDVLFALILALALHFLISEALLKHGLLALVEKRDRPYIAHPDDVVAVGHLFDDSSFPSSHNATSAAVATVFASFYRRAWPIALLFVLAMAFARMHNGMHYPTDVLTGIALGVGYGLLARVILRKIRARFAPVAAASSPVDS